jgi:adenine deaminase
MTNQKETEAIHLLLCGVVSKMPAEEQQKVRDAVDEINRVVEQYGDHGFVALSLVATEKGMGE